MKDYIVEWVCDFEECDDPHHAAELAVQSIRDGDCLAFTVIDKETREKIEVDL